MAAYVQGIALSGTVSRSADDPSEIPASICSGCWRVSGEVSFTDFLALIVQGETNFTSRWLNLQSWQLGSFYKKTPTKEEVKN